MGIVIPSALRDPVDIAALRDHVHLLGDSLSLLDGAFHVIVDTGCTNSASPFKEDFEELKTLPKPIKLHGIGGVTETTQGGVLRYQCINSKGEIVTIRTFGFYNPHQNVHLFGPQAYFNIRGDKKGEFTISWTKTFLSLPEGEIPCHIDKTTFMPLLTCFHDADKCVQALVSPTAFPDAPANTNLTATQKLLYKFHCKLGHLGFGHLKWFLRQGILGHSGIQCGGTEILAPVCEACLTGGQQKRPIPGNNHTQVPKMTLKREQLTPGQWIFSDQYVSSVQGRNFNGCGHAQTQNSYKGGIVFCDAASSFMSVHHQVGFTAHETICSKLTFEREAATVGISIQSYNTDNGVYTAK